MSVNTGTVQGTDATVEQDPERALVDAIQKVIDRMTQDLTPALGQGLATATATEVVATALDLLPIFVKDLSLILAIDFVLGDLAYLIG